jgi:hypothetical protein
VTHVADEVNRQCGQILIPGDVQISCQTVQLRIANLRTEKGQHLSATLDISGSHTVAPVQERQEIEERQRRQQFPVQTPQEGFLVNPRGVRERIVRDKRLGIIYLRRGFLGGG